MMCHEKCLPLVLHRVKGSVHAKVIGWVPTGWTYENKRNMFPVKKKGNCSIHLVPYSEHSSYSELQTYVKFLRPHEVSRHATIAPCLRLKSACIHVWAEMSSRHVPSQDGHGLAGMPPCTASTAATASCRPT